MKKKCTRILFTILCIITILMSMVVPSGAIGFINESFYNTFNRASLQIEQKNMLVPFTLYVDSNTKSSALGSSYTYDGIYAVDFYTLNLRNGMDPSGNVVLSRYYCEDDTISANAYYTVDLPANITDWRAPTTNVPGWSRIVIDPSVTGGALQSDTGMKAVYLKSGGYSLPLSKYTSSTSYNSTVTFQNDPDVTGMVVEYLCQVLPAGTDDVVTFTGKYTIGEANGVGVLPPEISTYIGNTDIFVLKSDCFIEFQGNDTNQYDMNIIINTYGGNSTKYYLSNTGFTDLYVVPAFTGDYNTGYDDGYADGEDDGYQEGLNASWGSLDFTGWIGSAIGGFMDVALFGNFTIGGMLAVVVSLTLVLTFLKFFAGG